MYTKATTHEALGQMRRRNHEQEPLSKSHGDGTVAFLTVGPARVNTQSA